MSGFSARHGGHQLAQKLIQTGWPRNSLSLWVSPSNVCTVKSGASLPTLGAGPDAAAVRVMDWLDPAIEGDSKYQTMPTIAMPTMRVVMWLGGAPTFGGGKGVRKMISGGGSGGGTGAPGSGSAPPISGSPPPGAEPRGLGLRILLSIAVETSEEQVAVVSEESCAEANDEQAGAPGAPPAAEDTGVQVAAIDQPCDQGRGLLGVPAPVAAPGDVRPDGAEDDCEEHRRKSDHHGLVPQFIEDG